MTRADGRAPRGQRVHDRAPAGPWRTTPLISSIRIEGTTAGMTGEGATDTDMFEAFARTVLAPTLKPGDGDVMDNLSAHKAPRTIRPIEQTGAQVLFLTAYAPDLNPIEKTWSKVKEFLRAAQARTEQALWAAIAAALDVVTPQDAIGWFALCGFDVFNCLTPPRRIRVNLMAALFLNMRMGRLMARDRTSVFLSSMDHSKVSPLSPRGPPPLRRAG